MPSIFRHILNRGLAHIMRFSAMPQHFHESVAEHSFYVAYFANILCEMLEEKGVKINKEKAMTMALVHDAEEMFSGDILTPFKYRSTEVREAIKKVNIEVIKEAFHDLPEHIEKKYINLWNEESAQQSIEAQIIKKADKLSLLGKCAEEIKAGNTFFQEIYDTQLQKLREDEQAWWVKIKDDILPRP